MPSAAKPVSSDHVHNEKLNKKKDEAKAPSVAEKFRGELLLLLESGYPLLYIVTSEEKRAEAYLQSVCEALGRSCIIWSVTTGYTRAGAETKTSAQAKDPLEAAEKLSSFPSGTVIVLKDFTTYLSDPYIVRRIRDANISGEVTIVILSPTVSIPSDLEKDATVLALPLPDRTELSALLANEIQVAKKKLSPAQIEELTIASLGLTATETRRVIAKGLAAHDRFGEPIVDVVIREKSRLIRRAAALEFTDVHDSLADVGGLNELKDWLKSREVAFGEEARAYGLPAPRGLVLLGVQGCGKSLTAKAVAGLWNLPLLRLDIGIILDSGGEGTQGSGDSQLRLALAVAESVAPAVLWIDEIEKAFATGNSHDAVEGEVRTTMPASENSRRLLATLTTWLQEKSSPVYVVATANSVADMPPELLRKGRFDEIFFVDLPFPAEREEIFRIHLRKRKRNPDDFDISELAHATHGFSGAEIEEVLISAMYDAFAEKREVADTDIMKSVEATVPLSRTMEEKVKAIREWASTRARRASTDRRVADLLTTSEREPVL